MTLLLTRDELEALTGTKQPKRMCAWCTARGWIFERPARRGDVPKVDRAYYLARMSGQRTASIAPIGRPRVRVDFMVGSRA
jgi:hypothetical protein